MINPARMKDEFLDLVSISSLSRREGSIAKRLETILKGMGATIEVDDAGVGLHVSVCFAPDRGDEHDHHALDLLLGHLRRCGGRCCGRRSWSGLPATTR